MTKIRTYLLDSTRRDDCCLNLEPFSTYLQRSSVSSAMCAVMTITWTAQSPAVHYFDTISHTIRFQLKRQYSNRKLRIKKQWNGLILTTFSGPLFEGKVDAITKASGLVMEGISVFFICCWLVQLTTKFTTNASIGNDWREEKVGKLREIQKLKLLLKSTVKRGNIDRFSSVSSNLTVFQNIKLSHLCFTTKVSKINQTSPILR